MIFLSKLDKHKNKGFTLIELIVVFTIIAVISSISVASFVDYSRARTLKSASLELVSALNQAKSRAQNQVKPSSGCTTLRGYVVRICGLVGSACTTPNTYAIYAVCSNGNIFLTRVYLPTNVTYSQSQTTSLSFNFKVLQQGVSGAGYVSLQGYDDIHRITVSPIGSVSLTQ